MDVLEQRLLKDFDGEVRFDRQSRHVYSVDASIFEIEPIGVVIPRTEDAYLQAVQIAREFEVPIISRGAATGIAGGCIGRGLIIDCSKYLNKILDIDIKKEIAICQPGVVQDQLNQALAPHGYRLGPDTSTGNRATLGGMAGNNSSGARSLRFGKTVDHVEAMDLILASGKKIHLEKLNQEAWDAKASLRDEEGNIYRSFRHLLSKNRDLILSQFPKLQRRVAGYNLDEFTGDFPWNLSKIVVGSEGSLGAISRLHMRIVKAPKYCSLVVLHFKELVESLTHVGELLEFSPLSLELIDRDIIEMGRVSPSLRGRLDWLKGDPGSLIVVELDAENEKALRLKERYFLGELGRKLGYAQVVLTETADQANVWALRKSGLGLLLSRRSWSRAVAFVEDISVPPLELASFISEFKAYLLSKGKAAGIYGHAGAGCIHLRPYIDLRDPTEQDLMVEILQDTAELLLKYKGTLSGEHGDGLIRSWLNEKMFGKEIYDKFLKVKQIFDPYNRMNPGKVVNGPPPRQDLRMDPAVRMTQMRTAFDFSKAGGFELSVDMCNGNGQCRKREGLMCPSFQAYGDERHSTRARAQALRSIVTGRAPLHEISSPNLLGILDDCLECKGCKTECPSQVDMAKIKSEILHQAQESHGYSRRSKLFANLAKGYRKAYPYKRYYNWFINSSLLNVFKWKMGLAHKRDLPLFAEERFSTWAQRHHPAMSGGETVVLMTDSYTEFNYPEIGQAAVNLLEALGISIIISPWACCGRPLISKGFLREARAAAGDLVEQLTPWARRKLPIISLEPSCLSALRDDYPDLISTRAAELVAGQSMSLEEYLCQLMEKDSWVLPFSDEPRPVKVHGHCHQKSLIGMKPTMDILRSVPGFEVEEIPSGCCGLAGSWGYEREHYDMSMAIGEDRLFPAIREAPDNSIFVASGMSCRSQIAHGTGKRAKHLAEVLADRVALRPFTS